MGHLNYLISTPNADWVPQYPFVNVDFNIVKREDERWGGNEYTRWPQPYTESSIHHACIPFDLEMMSRNTVTSSETTLADDTWDIILYNPDQSRDFNLTEVEKGLGQIKDRLIDRLDSALTGILEKTQRIGQQRSREGADCGTESIFRRCKVFGSAALDNLRIGASWRDTLCSWCDVQRAILELYGLHTFLEIVLDRIKSNFNYQDKILPVRGAFTTKFSYASKLFRLGIPVWFICTANTLKGKVYSIKECVPWNTCISDKVPRYSERITRKGIMLNLDDSKRDLANTQITGEYLFDQLLEQMYGNRLGASTFEAQPSISITITSNSAPRTVTPVPPVQNSTKQSKKRKRERDINYSRFLYIPNGVDGRPDLPNYNSTVMSLLSKVDTITDNINRSSRYPLPPPFLLVHANADKSAELYLNYVRVRPTLLNILTKTGSFDQSVWRRLRDWKQILHGGDKSLALLPNTIAPVVLEPSDSPKELLPKREDMIDMPPTKRQRIDDDVTKTSMRFGYEIEPLDRSKTLYWLGMPVLRDLINLDKELRQQIQWELSEILFRYELHALDEALLPRSRMTNDQRIKRAYQLGGVYSLNPIGSTIALPDLSKPISEYWGEYPDEHYVRAFHSVLKDWPGFPLGADACNFKILAAFYIKTFIAHYDRLPTMHCNVPFSLRC